MKRVLIVGAGFNKNFKEYGIDIPVLNEIFINKFLKKDIKDYSNLYQFLSKYCNYEKQTLKNTTIDIEEIFTLFQQKLNSKIFDPDGYQSLNEAYKELKSIIEYHYSFNSTLEKIENRKEISYWKFIKYLKDKKIEIITFNYDNIIEESMLIESFKGFPKNIDRKNWNGPLYYFNNTDSYLSYNFEFLNSLELKKENSDHLIPLKLCNSSNNMVKFHGSFNWYLITDFKVIPGEIDAQNQKVIRNPKIERDKNALDFVGKSIYKFLDGIKLIEDNKFIPWHNYKGYLVRELLVLPELIKHELGLNFFKNNLDKTKEILSDCEELIMIGYSFPNTDFHIKRLFLDIFSSNNQKLKSLIVINPDKDVIEETVRYTHFTKKIKVFKDLKDFIDKELN